MSEKQRQTTISTMRIKEKTQFIPSGIEWVKAAKPHRGESFMKNLAVAAALVLCAVTLRTGAVPSLAKGTDVVLTAATDHTLLDEQLGKLSFVSAFFPEAVLVFGEDTAQSLLPPIEQGNIVQAWSEARPYTSWRGTQENSTVSAASSGEVIGVYHGNEDERLVQVMSSNGLSCIYGNLSEVLVQTGDRVTAGDALGYVLPGKECVFEVRKDGYSVDPELYMTK